MSKVAYPTITIEPRNAAKFDTIRQRQNIRVERETDAEWVGFPVGNPSVEESLVFPKAAWQRVTLPAQSKAARPLSKPARLRLLRQSRNRVAALIERVSTCDISEVNAVLKVLAAEREALVKLTKGEK